MRSSRYNLFKKPLLLLVILTLLPLKKSLAEDAGGGGAGDLTIETPPPAQPKSDDRGDGNGAAAAMAALGAAMAGVSCAMLMAQAAKEEDPAEKRKLMAMAMQQCAQAAMNAAMAAMNKNNEKSNKADDNAAPTKMTVAATKIDTKPNKSEEMPALTTDASSAGGPDFKTIEVPEVTVPELGEAPKVATAEPETAFEDYNPKFAAAGSSFTPLEPLDPKGLTYEDPGNKPGSNAAAGLGFMRSGGGGGNSEGSGNTTDIILANAGSVSEVPAFRTKGAAGGATGPGEGGGGEGSGGEGGPNAFESILSQIMGGGAAPGASDVVGGGAGTISFGNGRGGRGSEKPVNIFEFASYRFTQAHKDGVVRSRKEKRSSPTDNTSHTIEPKLAHVESGF